MLRGCYTFNSEVEERRLSEEGKEALLPQNKPLLSQETSLKGPTNPAQRVPSYKDVRNPLTPPESVSHPPQGYKPPFHTCSTLKDTPAPGLCFC